LVFLQLHFIFRTCYSLVSCCVGIKSEGLVLSISWNLRYLVRLIELIGPSSTLKGWGGVELIWWFIFVVSYPLGPICSINFCLLGGIVISRMCIIKQLKIEVNDFIMLCLVLIFIDLLLLYWYDWISCSFRKNWLDLC